jgi:4-amino-4-deoxy-L-arabinose transferase-like glycosyltransferase
LRWRLWILSAIACGLGLLTKGPVALALVVPPLVAVGWLDRRLARVGWRGWAAFASVALLTAAPWYLAVIAARPDFAQTFVWRHHILRFLAPFDHAKPAWFYLPGLALGLMPWVLLIPVLARRLLDRSAHTSNRPAALGLALACFVWTLLFFSASGCKRPTYLLPALPPLALALGWVIAERAPQWRLLVWRGSRLAAATAGLALMVGVGLALTAALTQMIRPAQGFTLAAAGLVVLAILATARRVPWAVAGLAIFATLFVGVREMLPEYNHQFALRGQLRREAGQPEQARRPVVCYPMRYDSVGFYLPDVPVRVFTQGQKRELLDYLEAHPDSLVVIKSGAYRDVVQDLPTGLTLKTKSRRGAVVVGRMQSIQQTGTNQN